jgi:hypothetical protein
MNCIRDASYKIQILSVSILVATCTPASGEVTRIVSPPEMENVEGNSSVRPNVAPNRLQFFFPASDFAGLPASHRLLVALNFRGDRTQTQAVERIFPEGQWWMSTTDKTSGTLLRAFADNHGPDKTLVHDDLYMQHILGTGPPQGPRDFADGMRFQKPFYYDPSQGNLLIEHIWRTTGNPVPQPALDNQASPEFTLLVGGHPDATSGNLLTGRSITQFEFAAPLPGDYDASGNVDQADLDLALLHWGQDAATPPAGWVTNLPMGLVDQAELDGVLLNWGNQLEAFDVESAPEPSSLLLVAVGAVAAVAVRVAAHRRR